MCNQTCYKPSSRCKSSDVNLVHLAHAGSPGALTTPSASGKAPVHHSDWSVHLSRADVLPMQCHLDKPAAHPPQHSSCAGVSQAGAEAVYALLQCLACLASCVELCADNGCAAANVYAILPASGFKTGGWRTHISLLVACGPS